MGIFLAVVCAVLYSSNYILIQRGMRISNKDNGNFASLLGAVGTISLIYLGIRLFGTEPAAPWNWTGFFFYLAAGFFTAFLGRVLLNAGIRKIGSSRAAAVKNAAPMFTILIAVGFIGERITWGAGAGIAIILIALFIQARHDFAKAENVQGKRKIIGLVLTVCAAASFGIGQAARKQGVLSYDEPILGSLIGSFFALIVFVLMEITQKRFKETVWNNFQKMNPFFILAGVLTGVAQVSFFLSLVYTNVSYTSVVAAMEPVITVILGRLFLNQEENIQARIVLTACAVFLGTVVLILGK